MNPLLALFICTCGVAGLFYLNRDKTHSTSKALWLPIIYLSIIGSRPVSAWMGMTPAGSVNGRYGAAQLEGSPVDAAIIGVLLLAAIGVLIRRKGKMRILLAANFPILIYFFYCLVSVTWSFHPDISLKRWIKATIDLAMAMIIVTESDPVTALRRLISRVGFVMLPASVLLIKYFPNIGRGYGPFGEAVDTGVTTNKNLLGILILVISLGTLWHVMALLHTKAHPDRRRHLIAHGVLLVFGIALFEMAHSATAIACFMLGAGLMLALNLRVFRRRPVRVQALCIVLFLAGACAFVFTGSGDVANALGRNSNLSGRTEIWAALIPTVPNAIIGAGYEGYWISPSADQLWNSLRQSGWYHPELLVNEAHNGYIEVYLNLGCVGLGLVALILMSGYRQAIAAVRRDPSISSLMLAYIIVSATYAITEAGFRSLDPMWFFLLLAIVGATGVNTGVFGKKAARQRTDSMVGHLGAKARTTVYAMNR